jgi:hypothetical protein
MTEFTIVIMKNELFAFEKIDHKFETLKIKGEVSVDLDDCSSPSELAERIVSNYIQDKVVNADFSDVNMNIAYCNESDKFLPDLVSVSRSCRNITVYPIEKELVNILLKLNKIKPGTSSVVKIEDVVFDVKLEENGKNIINRGSDKKPSYELKAEDIANSFIANYKFISNQKEIEKLHSDVESSKSEIKRLTDKLKKYGIPLDFDENNAIIASYDSKKKYIAGKILKATLVEVKKSGAKLICDKTIEVWISFGELKKCYGDAYTTVLKPDIEFNVYFKDDRTALVSE